MRFLIIKTSSLGDIVHIFPVLELLKGHYPTCLIDIVVEKPFAELIQAHPCINQVYVIESKKWRSHCFSKGSWKEIVDFARLLRTSVYDVIFDVQGNSKSALITAIAKGKRKVGFGWSSVAEWPNLLVSREKYSPPPCQNIRLDYLFVVKSALGLPDKLIESHSLLTSSIQSDRMFHHQGKKIMVCPGSQWPNKQLSIETWIDFLRELSTKHDDMHVFFIWGTEAEKAMVYELHQNFLAMSSVVDRLPLGALQHVMARMDLVIAVDSLPLHLAGTTNTPTWSVFGPSSALKYKPYGEQHVSFQGICPYEKTFVKRCPLLRTCSTGACMKNINGKKLCDFYGISKEI